MQAMRLVVQPLMLICGLALATPDPAWGQCEIIEDNDGSPLAESDAAEDNGFGEAVALRGNVLAVGSPESNGGLGSVKVFEFDTDLGLWFEVAELAASGLADQDGFGSDVAMTADGSVTVVGAPGNISSSGAVYVFERPGGGWADMTMETAKLTPQDSATDDAFGKGVDIDGLVIVVGASRQSTGAAYVFERQGPVWTDMTVQTQKLLPDDFMGGDDQFGSDVAVDGNVIVVGALGEDDTSTDEGAAYVFRLNGTWQIEDKLTASDGAGADWFGSAVDVDGDAIVIGAWHDDGFTGAAYVFRDSGGTWMPQEQKLTASDGGFGDFFAVSVAIAGDRIVAGARTADGLIASEGAAYVFNFDSDAVQWSEGAKLIASDGSAGDDLGRSVTISSGRAAAGAPNDDHAGPIVDAGSAYVFSVDVLCDLVWDNDFGGAFGDSGNWQPQAVPGPSNQVVFDFDVSPNPLTASYPVFFTAARTTDRLLVRSNREIQFRLLGVDYQVTGAGVPGAPSIVVGELADLPNTALSIENTGAGLQGVFASTGVSIGDASLSSGALTVTGPGTIFGGGDLLVGGQGTGSFRVDSGASTNTTGDVSIASLAGSAGSVTLTDAGSTWTTTGSVFYVGEAGQATVTISNGAQLLSSTLPTGIFLADEPGAGATVTVSGAGSAWMESNATMFIASGGPAAVVLADGTIGAPTLEMLAQAELLGNGSVIGDVFNTGAIRPGTGAVEGTAGVLSVDGDYDQRGIPAGGGVEESGSLFIDLAGTLPGPGPQFDQLLGTGEAALGGGLFVSVADGFEPQVDDTFLIMQFDSSLDPTGTFDVAFVTGLPQGLLITVDYSPGCDGSGVCQISLVVLDLNETVGFNDPVSFGLDGVPSGAVAEDFNGDTFPDLAVSVPSTNSIFVLLNDGAGSFPGLVEIPVGTSPSALAAAPLDANGSFDLAVTNAGDDTVSILLNDGNGVFVVDSTVAVGNSPSAVAAADFDEDALGDIDLVVANFDDDTLQVLSNDGVANFVPGAPITLSGGLGPVAVDPTDLDNDKDLDEDMASANQNSNNLSVITNLGGGSFGPAVNLEVGNAPVALTADDLDGDGSSDIVTANNGDGTVSVAINNGDGTFSPAVNLPVGDLPRSLAALDLEGDQDLDLAVVVTDESGNRVVRVLRNDLIHDDIVEEQLSFVLDQDLAQGQNPALVLAADVDQDGTADIVTVNENVAGEAAGPAPASLAVLINTAVVCPWDCGEPADGMVGIEDFLAVLGTWGQTGAPCDFDGNGVGINDFLKILGLWGPCP